MRSTRAPARRRRRRDRVSRLRGLRAGGAAILVEALTDNRNRTGAEVRHAFESQGGTLGEPGSVSWQFEKRGLILVDGERYGEDDLIPAIDAGAEDVSEDGGVLKVLTAAGDLAAVRSALEDAGVEIESAGVDGAEVDGRGGGSAALLRLMDTLEERDDVDSVHAFDVPEEVLERAAAAG